MTTMRFASLVWLAIIGITFIKSHPTPGDIRMIILVGICAVIYFAPAIVAAMRSHRQTAAIVLLNLFLGWTLVGWVVALVWAAMNGPQSAPGAIVTAGHRDAEPSPDCY
jgi:hypothetical protein